MYFEVVGEITDVEVIAIGGNIDDIMRLSHDTVKSQEPIRVVRREQG